MQAEDWYSVSSTFRQDTTEDGKPRRSFEERVVLFRATSFEAALTKGEAEAKRYAASLRDGRMLDHIVAYHIHDDELREGDEIWSCVRDLDISDEDFVRRVYDGELESYANVHLHSRDA
jgi:hypothetical protein